MTMPTGDSAETAQDYYDYLLAHHQNDGRIVTWDVDWVSLAWMWGFVAALTVLALLWVWQYRTTLARGPGRGGLYPIDRFGSYVAEEARPVSPFFLVLTLGLTLFAAVIVVGHLIWGQIF
jgi:hypothetical protein